MSSDSRISLRIANNRAYVWDVDDIETIRSEHHICGLLTGTLPHLSQQNVFLGVPLVLMPEEVVLLVEKELAVLIDDPHAHQEPSISDLQRWDLGRKESMKRHMALSEAKGGKEGASLGRSMTDEAIRKRKEREEKRANEATKSMEASTSGDGRGSLLLQPTVNEPSSLSNTALGIQGASPSTPYPMVIPASSSSFEWYNSNPCVYTTIASAKAAGVWSYPSTLLERAKCGVFKGLWEQGYFMGGGIKFGGDYLVYPGDPLRYHSHFVASVLDSPTSALRPMEVVAHGRLGTATKKAHMLCGWDDEKQEASYLSVEWAGFG